MCSININTCNNLNVKMPGEFWHEIGALISTKNALL